MIVLRREEFGGIIFNGSNAVQLSLDKEGFFLMEKYLAFPQISLPAAEKSFVNKILETLEIKNAAKLEIKKAGAAKRRSRKYPFEVLSFPTLADIQITARCNLHCPHCYAESSFGGENIAWQDFILALDNFSRAGVFQVALGGGEPTLHPQFKEMLKAVRERGMVPNLTTNGKILTAETAKAMAKYCGAIALSVEGTGRDFEKRRNFSWKNLAASAKRLKECGNRLVFQVTVSGGNIEKLPEITDSLLDFYPHGIIFLAYKPCGRGKFFDDVLAKRNPAFVRDIIRKCLDKISGKVKIGFDCCFVEGIIELAREISPFDFGAIEGCSALRNSLAVTRNLDVVPCSFIDRKVGNLKSEKIEDIWQGKLAEKFRRKFCGNIEKPFCKFCSLKYQCLGGCPEFKLINCSRSGI